MRICKKHFGAGGLLWSEPTCTRAHGVRKQIPPVSMAANCQASLESVLVTRRERSAVASWPSTSIHRALLGQVCPGPFVFVRHEGLSRTEGMGVDGGNVAGESHTLPCHSSSRRQGVLFRDLHSRKTGVRGLDNKRHFRVSRI